MTMSKNPYRLPLGVRPTRYSLELRPDLEESTFTGTVSIEIVVDEPTDRIVLNSLDLTLDDVRVAGVPVASVDFDVEAERVTLSLAEHLVQGASKIEMLFAGVLNDRLVGFYRSTFASDPEDPSAIESIAVTQFESTHARSAFPCFDEPALKARFEVSLIVDSDLFAVSNGAQISRVDLGDGTARVEFAETMVMSTYLVAFVVGRLTATEPRMVAGANGPIPLRVIHRPGSEHLCDFALEVAEAALLYFEDYYGIAYPGDKVDLVAVPDFAFGAMENLGCVTFREVLLLIDPAAATQPELQRVADVINHELAHMWFGDLVTMDWWNGIWLNEAFATFMENMASDAFRPDWDVWTNFGLARAAAFDTDSLASTRPIEYEVISPADSEGMFDVLTYEKGASVVRMLEQYLGAETFRRGIASYLSTHAYGTTETTDLWDSLEEVSGEPVRSMMDRWILRGGYPLVTVEPTSNGVMLAQERFSYASQPQADAGQAPDESWSIPIRIRAEVGGEIRTERILLIDETEVDLGANASRVQVNVDGIGFFRSSYDDGLLQALATDPDAGPLERFVLIDDMSAALNAGRLDHAEMWRIIDIVARSEMHPAVWRRLGAAIRELGRLVGPDKDGRTATGVNSATENALGWVKSVLMEGDVDADSSLASKAQELRGLIVGLRGTIGSNDHVREHARIVFGASGDLPIAIDASLQAAAIEVVAYTATPDEHQELQRRWRQASTPQEELRYLTALVDTDSPELFADALDLALSEVRTQNAPYLLQRAISHRCLAPQAWSFVASNWESITQRFPSNSLARMLAGIRSTTDRELATTMAHDIEAFELPSGRQQLDQHLERMWVTVAAAERVRG